MAKREPGGVWAELQRRHVPRVAAYYVAGAWVAAQAAGLVLDAFEATHYLRYVIGTLAIGFPVALALAWIFDVTPHGIQRTLARIGPEAPVASAPATSIAVLPFANLSNDPANEYFSDGLSEEIRNQLARIPGLQVAARTSSFVFKGHHEDVREIGRRLNVATLLEGGVRKDGATVRIDVQLVNTADGFHAWSRSFERRLDDAFRLQSEVATAVMTAVSERQGLVARALPAPEARSFGAYNAYLLGRHHFHKRNELSLRRAAQCFEQAIAQDPNYALAYSGLADTDMLLSCRYYGTLTTAQAVAQALPLVQKALSLEPDLAEAHASLGLIDLNRGRCDLAQRSLERAMQLNPGYTMAHVWHGLALVAEGRYREAAEHNQEAFRLDPLSPIVNTNVGFDAWRFGDHEEAGRRFAAAMEIDPAFAVPYSGMSKLASCRGDMREALSWIDRAIERAPTRAYFAARKTLLLMQTGDREGALACLTAVDSKSQDGVFDPELRIALLMASSDRAALARIASGESGAAYSLAQRAQARIALDEPDAARALYEREPPDARREIDEILNDDWIWRLPHSINLAHLRLTAGDERGGADLEQVLREVTRAESQGIVNADVRYWSAAALALLGQREAATRELDEARRRGWRNAWWETIDWNLRALN